MRFDKYLKIAATVGFAALLAVVFSTPAAAQRTVRWKMQSAFGSKLPHLGPPATRFVDDVKVMSGGKMVFKFFEPGALVPPFECFDVVSKGSVDSCWTTPGYHTSKYPALSFFTAVPFGPQLGEYLAWMWISGGAELKQEIYKKHNLFSVDGLAIGPETSGWFRNRVTVDDLRGMKIRFFGLGAKVMQKMGVSTQLLAGADIYPALERGVIDATEFSMPTIDIALGFYQIAKYNYFPGWHQQVSVSEVLMNRGKYNALPKQFRRIIKVAAGYQVIYNYAESEAKNFGAMLKMSSKFGVKRVRWPDSALKKFELAWREVVQEESAKDPLFKKVSENYFAFRAKYKVWKDAQALKATYLE